MLHNVNQASTCTAVKQAEKSLDDLSVHARVQLLLFFPEVLFFRYAENIHSLYRINYKFCVTEM